MSYQKDFYTTEKTLIKYEVFKSKESSQKILIYIHGFAGTLPQIISPFYQTLNKQKIDFYIPYQRYTPWSNQTPGHINSDDELLFDLRQFIEFISRENPNKKIYLLGHSFGANLVLNLAPSLEKLITRIIIINPSQKTKLAFEPVFLFKYIFHRFFQSDKTVFHIISDPKQKKGEQDKAEARLRQTSPHIARYFSFTFLKEMKKNIQKTNHNIQKITKPALFVISQKDETVVARKGLDLYHQYKGPKKIIRPDAGHGTYVMNLTKDEITDFILSEEV